MFNKICIFKNFEFLELYIYRFFVTCHCSFNVILKYVFPKQKFTTYCDFKDVDEIAFQHDLVFSAITLWNYVILILNQVQFLIERIKHLFNKHCPYRKPRASKPCVSLLTYTVKIGLIKLLQFGSTIKNFKNLS